MLIIEAIYSVLGGMNISTDDHGIPKRFVYRDLVSARSELLAQDANKMRLWGGAYSQTINRIKMKYTDISDYPDLPTSVMLHRSEIEVPKCVSTNNGELITGLYTLAGKPITLKNSYEDVVAHFGKRFVMPGPIAFIENRRLNVVAVEHIQEFFVRLAGVFINPELVGKLNEDPCEDDTEHKCKAAYEYEFPLPGNIDRRVIEIAKKSVSLKLGIPLDNTNDAGLSFKPGTNAEIRS